MAHITFFNGKKGFSFTNILSLLFGLFSLGVIWIKHLMLMNFHLLVFFPVLKVLDEAFIHLPNEQEISTVEFAHFIIWSHENVQIS